MPVVELLKRYFQTGGLHRHQAYPVVDEKGLLLGVITRTNLLEDWVGRGLNADLTSDVATMNVIIAYDLIQRTPITAYAWESCRTAAEKMAEASVGRLLVVADDNPQKMIGIVTAQRFVEAARPAKSRRRSSASASSGSAAPPRMTRRIEWWLAAVRGTARLSEPPLNLKLTRRRRA